MSVTAASSSSSSTLTSASSTCAPPSLMYGTAWKKSATTGLVQKAYESGYRGFDTANQPKHYNEPAMGDALKPLLSSSASVRGSLFIQTKFTPLNGQDRKSPLPYNPADSVYQQVLTSFQSSLDHLGVAYLDSYLLHGPYGSGTLTKDDWECWKAMTELYEKGVAKRIGISNVNIDQLRSLYASASVKPMVVQNRCYAVRGWDESVRSFCIQNNIIYQGFSLLTANPHIVRSTLVQSLAKKYSKTNEQIIFRFAIQSGMQPLTGTTNENHMKEDLKANEFELTKDEVKEIMRRSVAPTAAEQREDR